MKKNKKFDVNSFKKKYLPHLKETINLIEIEGEIDKKKQGYAFLLHSPEDYFISEKLAKNLTHGDIVKAIINPKTKEVTSLEVKTRSLKKFIGTLFINKKEKKVIYEERGITYEVFIEHIEKNIEIHNEDKVLVEITQYNPYLKGKILKSFGKKLAPKYDTFSIVVRSGWPQHFSKEAIEESKKLAYEIQEQAKLNHYKGRKDLRDRDFVTIDGKDSRDFDDAICVEKTNHGYILYVAVADVAEFVKQNSLLDKEAYQRATSVYFPEWVIPMLPETLSNGACSLNPNEEKLVLVCEMHFNFEGKKKTAKVYEAVIKSKRRCIYEDVQKEYENGVHFWQIPYELYFKIRKNRFIKGALDLDLPETKIILDKEGNTIDIKKLERLDSHKLIEEFMIAANESVTEIMEREKWPFVYRVHEPPKNDALEKLIFFTKAYGIKFNFQDSNNPKTYSKFIELIKDKPFSNALNYLLLRSLKQAKYYPENLYHFGLASRAYTHFTSPIRRYPDLIVHRTIKQYLKNRKLSEEERRNLNQYLITACEHCSIQERKAEKLDRQVIKIKKARFMEPRLGEVFNSIITNVSEAGLFIELEDFFIEGLVPIDLIGHDYFEYLENKFLIRGKRTGLQFRIGDRLKVQLVKVDIEQGNCEFELIKKLR
jgi:ribonuclease R